MSEPPIYKTAGDYYLVDVRHGGELFRYEFFDKPFVDCQRSFLMVSGLELIWKKKSLPRGRGALVNRTVITSAERGVVCTARFSGDYAVEEDTQRVEWFVEEMLDKRGD